MTAHCAGSVSVLSVKAEVGAPGSEAWGVSCEETHLVGAPGTGASQVRYLARGGDSGHGDMVGGSLGEDDSGQDEGGSTKDGQGDALAQE